MESRPLIVVGAGVSGTAAAIEAAKAGVTVTLIDENPVPTSMAGLNVPLFFGQKFDNALNDRVLMMERVASTNEVLVEAEEAGVDIQLGTCVWGSFRNSENSRLLDGPQIGLANHERSWMMKYERLIVATGSRDLSIGFAGCDLAGAMGANGAHSLMSRYKALSARRMVILGSGNLGLNTAKVAIDNGIEVAAIVDIASSVRGDKTLATHLQSKGVELYTSHTVKEAVGSNGNIESVVLVEIDNNLEPIAGTENDHHSRHPMPSHRTRPKYRNPQPSRLRPCLQVRTWRLSCLPTTTRCRPASKAYSSLATPQASTTQWH